MLEVERIILKNAALFHSTLKETGSIHLIRQFVIRATKNVNPDESWESAPGKNFANGFSVFQEQCIYIRMSVGLLVWLK